MSAETHERVASTIDTAADGRTVVHLSEGDSAAWEHSGELGDRFRRELRGRILASVRAVTSEAASVEVYSHDGVTFDAYRIEATPAEGGSDGHD